ncbi:Hpt domain-containing protein [Candidatus Dependentiae bacterium]|nr:Hpt domain-containing protein [Candidatus Dependentiae bacterium]
MSEKKPINIDPDYVSLIQDYIKEVAEQLHKLEALLLEGKQNVDYLLIKRIAHNIKGSAGSYGIHIISELFQKFEDNIKILEQTKQAKIDEYNIDILLAYIDYANNIFERINAENYDIDDILIKIASRNLNIKTSQAAQTVKKDSGSSKQNISIPQSSGTEKNLKKDGDEIKNNSSNNKNTVFEVIKNSKKTDFNAEQTKLNNVSDGTQPSSFFQHSGSVDSDIKSAATEIPQSDTLKKNEMSAENQSSALPIKAKTRILFVLKSVIIKQIISVHLEKKKVAVEYIDNIESSLEYIRKFKPDIVVVNYVEEFFSGSGLCALIKLSFVPRNIITVLLSSESDSVILGKEYCDYIIKKDEQMYGNINSIIDNYK